MRRLLALTLTLTLALALTGASHPTYHRADWPHWIDEDGDCQDTRTEVLIRDAQTVTYADDRQCEVASGVWVDPYTGQTITDPRLLDIDHVVPLKQAHDSGGWNWTQEEKRAYANDLSYRHHLKAVHRSENRQKGEKSPDRYRPPRQEVWCNYATWWGTIKAAWGLSTTPAERQALREMLGRC